MATEDIKPEYERFLSSAILAILYLNAKTVRGGDGQDGARAIPDPRDKLTVVRRDFTTPVTDAEDIRRLQQQVATEIQPRLRPGLDVRAVDQLLSQSRSFQDLLRGAHALPFLSLRAGNASTFPKTTPELKRTSG